HEAGRRRFLQTSMLATAAITLPNSIAALAEETLYNGIPLSAPWPPKHKHSLEPHSPPYLASPPDVIPIDVGRQLFVDDFLIAETTLTRTFHRTTYHPATPIL